MLPCRFSYSYDQKSRYLHNTTNVNMINHVIHLYPISIRNQIANIVRGYWWVEISMLKHKPYIECVVHRSTIYIVACQNNIVPFYLIKNIKHTNTYYIFVCSYLVLVIISHRRISQTFNHLKQTDFCSDGWMIKWGSLEMSWIADNI